MAYRAPLAQCILILGGACCLASAKSPASCQAEEPDNEETRAVLQTRVTLSDMEQKASQAQAQKVFRKIKRDGWPRFGIRGKKRSRDRPVARYGETNQQWQWMPGLKPSVSWIVTPYTGCLQAKDTTAAKERQVQCLDVFTMEHTDKRSCDPKERPCHSRPCTCPGLEVCTPIEKDTVDSECHDEEPISDAMDFEEMGCLRSSASAGTSEFFDDMCMTSPSDETCRDGLPWFSRVLPVMTRMDCFRFCVSKGLDLFGILDGKECRCGASHANLATFHEEEPRKALLFDKTKLKPCFFKHNLKVFRYTGQIQGTGIPVGLLAHTDEDTEYIFSVALKQKTEFEGEMEDGGPDGIYKPPPSLLQELPHCPDCNYQSIWPVRSTEPPETPWSYLEFKDYVIVPYRFVTEGEQFGVDQVKQNMDDTRIEAYRNAVKEIAKKTCAVFVEKTKAELEASGQGYIAVGVYKDSGCWAYPGYGGDRPYPLSLGWCNSAASMGSMIHENLHSLGVAHMQKRPDATQSVEGHGPYLQMHWDQIPDSWKSQYTPQQNMYMGSGYDGAGDPFQGWAPYDYGSIMHYGPNYPQRFDTIPSGHATGQRSAMSPGDISMINDLYQCRTPGLTAMPSPAPTPAPTRFKPENYNWWVKEGPCVLSEDMSTITSPNYPSNYNSNQKCKIEVKNFEARLTVEDWETENGFDKLYVNDQYYSGTQKPDGIVLASDIMWTSDESTEKKGWKISLETALTLPPIPAPTPVPTLPEEFGGDPVPTPQPTPVPPTPDPAPASWTIKSGNCEVSEGNHACLESPNYPEYYDKNEKCVVGVIEPAGPITIEDWSTESNYDVLTVNGQKYGQSSHSSKKS